MTATAIKQYFSKLWQSENTAKVPANVCPNCWGRQEWENQFYELKKDPHLTPEGRRYESFISKVVEKHVGALHKHADKYVCADCGDAVLVAD